MSDELKPAHCGCGGEARKGKIYGDAWTVECTECGIQSGCYDTEAEAITAWNRAMGAKDINVPTKERTAKVIEHKYYIGTALNIVGEPKFGYEYLCGKCKKKVIGGDEYCSHCGCRLEWK